MDAWARMQSLVVAIAMLVAAPALATMVPGGGPATSDCYAELDVVGADPASIQHGKKIVCRDGDPCDAGPCGDAVCDVVVRLCWNQHDPDLPACVPPASLDSLHVRGSLAALLVMPERMTFGDCTDALSIPIATTHDGKRPGRLSTRIRAKAPAGSTPMVDADTVRIVCLPRPFDECPMPATTTVPGATTTTTTTQGGPTLTTSTSTTTTTTIHSPRKTTTTRRPNTTTTTRRPSTTTAPVPTTTTPVPTTTIVVPTTTTAPEPTTTVAPTTTEPPPSTEPPTTTTPTTSTTTTTERHGHGGDGDGGIVIVIGL